MMVAWTVGCGSRGWRSCPAITRRRLMWRRRPVWCARPERSSSTKWRWRSRPAPFYSLGFRSPTDWLATTTREGVGQCKITLHLADRIRHMPIIRAAFGAGDLAESALRLLADAWSPDVAEVFARDEDMLCRWATTLSHKDFRFVLDTWRLHADPDQADTTAEQRYDSRSVHMSAMLDGMGRIDGTLDPEGFALVREAVRAVSQPSDDDSRFGGAASCGRDGHDGTHRVGERRAHTGSQTAQAEGGRHDRLRRLGRLDGWRCRSRPTSTAWWCRPTRSGGSRATARCTGW